MTIFDLHPINATLNGLEYTADLRWLDFNPAFPI